MPPKTTRARKGYSRSITTRSGRCKGEDASSTNSTSVAEPPADSRGRSLRDLPNELTSHIISLRIDDHRGGREELVKDLRALCLVLKSVIDVCQRELFRIAVLEPHQRLRGLWFPPEPEKETIPRFAEVIAHKPHLGSYVRRLICRLPVLSVPRTIPFDVSAALNTMGSVEDLTIEVAGWQTSELDVYSSGIRDALSRMMQRDGLKSLTVQNLTIPSLEFQLPSSLETLMLLDCWFDTPYFESFDPPEELKRHSPKISLKDLVIRGKEPVSSMKFMRKAEQKSSYHRNPVLYRDIENLEMVVAPEITPFVLAETQNLKALHLRNPFIYDADYSAGASPLQGINPACLESMTSLSYRVDFDVTYGDRIIVDPYSGLFLDPDLLRSFTHLEDVSINIHLTAGKWRYAQEETFGSQWGILDTTFAPSTGCPFPHLKRVALCVLLGVDDEYSDSFIENFESRVISSQFEGLKKLEREGVVSLVLGAEAWDHHIED